ncbi:hypothetical protein CHOTACABRAS_139 [Bacillus phage Chotacabras]|nr:hypothetical protein CHOTACABRAS_139 [Bacillus phage Chotacabras]QVW29022.1 hypothetical protein [Bacillus phage SWEP1]
MYSLLVGILLVLILLMGLWVMAGKKGIFEYIGDLVVKFINTFKN